MRALQHLLQHAKYDAQILIVAKPYSMLNFKVYQNIVKDFV